MSKKPLDESKKVILENVFRALLEAEENLPETAPKPESKVDIIDKGNVFDIIVNNKKYSVVSEAYTRTISLRIDELVKKLHKDSQLVNEKIKYLDKKTSEAKILSEGLEKDKKTLEAQIKSLEGIVKKLTTEVIKKENE